MDRKDFNDTVYADLCNISHCRINSLDHMARFHPSVKGGGNEGIKRVAKDFILTLYAYYNYYIQLIDVFENKYGIIDSLGEIKIKLRTNGKKKPKIKN